MKRYVILLLFIPTYAWTLTCSPGLSQNIYKESCLDIVKERLAGDCNFSPYSFMPISKDDLTYAKYLKDYENLTNQFINQRDMNIVFNYPDLIKVEQLNDCKIPFQELEKATYEKLECFVEWKKKGLSRLLKKMSKTNSWKKTVNDINSKYHKLLDRFETTLKNEWSFSLELNQGSPTNKILARLSESPLSKSSARKLKHSLDSFSNAGVKVNYDSAFLGDINAAYSDISSINIGFSTLYFYGPIKRVHVNPSIVNYHMNENHHGFTSWVLAHELAHTYTARITDARPLSDNTMNSILEKHRACLYNDENSERLIGEDLADMLAAEIMQVNEETLGPGKIEGIISGLCQLQIQGLVQDTISEAGHSSPINRLYNLVKYNKEIQDYLSCYVPENVCKIEFSPISI